MSLFCMLSQFPVNLSETVPELWFQPSTEQANMSRVLIILRQRSAIEGQLLLCRMAQ